MVNKQTATDGEWALLEVHLPGLAPEPIGILLRDVTVDRLYVRLRSEWWHILPDEQASEIWGELADDLEEQARDIGAAETLDWLDTTASHTLQVGQRRMIQVLDVKTTLDSLFRQNICVSDGPTLKSPERARERTVNSSLHTRLRVVTAVAATIAVGILLSQGPSHPMTKPSLNPFDTNAGELIVLPFSSGLAYQPTLLNIGWQATPVGRSSREVYSVTHKHKRFNTRYLAFHDPVRVHQMAPSSPSIDVDATSTADTPAQLLAMLPEPPQFKHRRNRLVHLFAMLTMPLKLLTSR